MAISRIRRKDNVEHVLIEVAAAEDIIPEYRGTPVAQLLAYQNFGIAHRHQTEAELLIGTCMDHRVQLRIPSNFAFVLRCAGANLGMLEFDVSFAIAVGNVRCVCLIGHNGCRMVDVMAKREAFVSGLVEGAGWDRRRAEDHFDGVAPRYGFGDAVEFLWREAQRLREMYAGITVAPLVYSLGDRRLRQIVEAGRSIATGHRRGEVERGEERQ